MFHYGNNQQVWQYWADPAVRADYESFAEDRRPFGK